MGLLGRILNEPFTGHGLVYARWSDTDVSLSCTMRGDDVGGIYSRHFGCSFSRHGM